MAVAPERCVGCGTCATVCPTAALEARKPDDKDLLRARAAALQANDGWPSSPRRPCSAAAGKYDPAKVAAVKSSRARGREPHRRAGRRGASSIVLVAAPRAAEEGDGSGDGGTGAGTPGDDGVAATAGEGAAASPMCSRPRTPRRPTRPPRWPRRLATYPARATPPPCCWRRGS
ncbi:MAG: 4Fe-4S binding protein [Coriobacteriaceae bacterium]